jgi:hypothetical protein
MRSQLTVMLVINTASTRGFLGEGTNVRVEYLTTYEVPEFSRQIIPILSGLLEEEPK